MKETFIEQSFYAASRKTIDDANAIIEKYQAQGYTLTLRQLYYQMVASGLIANQQREYKRLGELLSKARLAGYVDWDAIEDRTRYLRDYATFEHPRDFFDGMEWRYREQVWSGQETYCEVWIEKDALAGVVERICNTWRVPFFPCRGYVSQSEQYEAGRRLRSKLHDEGFDRVVIFHLGDHDPSGIHMTEDNDSRLAMFSGEYIEVRRLALNMDQVEAFDLPVNPTKESDSRHGRYYDRFGEGCSSWELDALEPTVISGLIEAGVKSIIDEELFNEKREHEAVSRTRIREHLDTFGKPPATPSEPEQPDFLY